MAYDAFLKLDGIKGESTDDKFKDEIEVLSFSWGATQQTGIHKSGGSGTTEKVTVESLVITKRLDAASTKLFEYCCAGKNIPSGVLHLHKATGDKQQYLEVKIHDAVVHKLGITGGADAEGSAPLEEVAFHFSKIEKKYTKTDHATGKAAGDSSMWWDLTKNKGSL